MERDYFMTADEALSYGIIDEIIPSQAVSVRGEIRICIMSLMMVKTRSSAHFVVKRGMRCVVWLPAQGVYICDECVELCREIIDEEFKEAAKFDLKEI